MARKIMQTLFKPLTLSILFILNTLVITACTSHSDISSNKETQTRYPLISAKQCVDAGGELVGDIGDGRIHRLDYLCNNGTAPIGSIKIQDEPVMTEGAVCCGP